MATRKWIVAGSFLICLSYGRPCLIGDLTYIQPAATPVAVESLSKENSNALLTAPLAI